MRCACAWIFICLIAAACPLAQGADAPLSDTEKKRVLALIAGLGADDFMTRQRSEEQLQEASVRALKMMRSALALTEDIEVRDRLRRALAHVTVRLFEHSRGYLITLAFYQQPLKDVLKDIERQAELEEGTLTDPLPESTALSPITIHMSRMEDRFALRWVYRLARVESGADDTVVERIYDCAGLPFDAPELMAIFRETWLQQEFTRPSHDIVQNDTSLRVRADAKTHETIARVLKQLREEKNAARINLRLHDPGLRETLLQRLKARTAPEDLQDVGWAEAVKKLSEWSGVPIFIDLQFGGLRFTNVVAKVKGLSIHDALLMVTKDYGYAYTDGAVYIMEPRQPCTLDCVVVNVDELISLPREPIDINVPFEDWGDAREPESEALKAALDKEISVESVDLPLEELLLFLEKLIHVKVVLDPKAIENGARQTPITLRVTKLPARQLLRWIAWLACVDWSPRGEEILITQPKPEMKIFYVRDLLNVVGEASNLQSLINKVLENRFSEPDCSVDEGNGCLYVVHHRDVHEKIQALLTHLRLHPDDKVFMPTRIMGLRESDSALLKKLESKVSGDFKDAELDTVLKSFQSQTGVSFIVDPRVLATADPNVTRHISAKFSNATLQQALSQALKSIDVGYRVQDGVVFVSNQISIDIECRVYRADTDRLGPASIGGMELSKLEDKIRENIQPQSWDAALGTLIEKRGCLLSVNATPEVQEQVGIEIEKLWKPPEKTPAR